MIARIWYGYTTTQNADRYEQLLKTEIIVGIVNRGIEGFLGIELLRNNVGEEEEFVTIMHFENLEAVTAFAGKDYSVSVVPPAAQTLLKRYDQKSKHYEVKHFLNC